MNNLRLGTGAQASSILHEQQQQVWWRQVLDPSGEILNMWNRIFFLICLIALFVDPLFFYLLRVDTHPIHCLGLEFHAARFLIPTRTLVDLFSAFHIVLKFRTAYIAPNSTVFGRGDLVTDLDLIASRYLKRNFAVDLAATLPLPQCVALGIMPIFQTRTKNHMNHAIALIIILQYIPRLIILFPLNWRIIKNTGVVAKTAWTGAAYNLILYLLASHALGAVWYLMSVERMMACWRDYCKKEEGVCQQAYFDCNLEAELKPKRDVWYNSTTIFRKCDYTADYYDYGMFKVAFHDQVASTNFIERYFYCLWFGLKSLSSYGQSVEASTNITETVFGIIVCILGLLFFSLLIGNVQTYLQSTTARLEEWRVKRRDTEEWMRHRQLPPNLQDRVRRFVQYNWLSTRGVKEEEILQELPLDLRREVQKHLCLDLVRRVPFFSKMDNQLLDAICQRLVSSLNTKGTYIVREGDPVNEMLFVIRGQLESSTTDGGRSGFFNSITLKNGDFCGEELLTWALVSSSHLHLPTSTRTVRCLTEVEAFALRADDLRFFAAQFKRLHSKKLQHSFRYYSHQWRTWGACILQAAWRRHRRRKLAEELARHESMQYLQELDEEDGVDKDGGSRHESTAITATLLARRFAKNTRRRSEERKRLRFVAGESSSPIPKLFKPDEPSF